MTCGVSSFCIIICGKTFWFYIQRSKDRKQNEAYPHIVAKNSIKKAAAMCYRDKEAKRRHQKEFNKKTTTLWRLLLLHIKSFNSFDLLLRFDSYRFQQIFHNIRKISSQFSMVSNFPHSFIYKQKHIDVLLIVAFCLQFSFLCY